MTRRTTVAMLVMILVSAIESAAQDFFYLPESSGQFRTATVFYDNFFQDPIAGTMREVWAGLVELRLEETVGGSDRLKAYMRLEYIQFRRLGSSPGAVAGLKRRGQRHSFDAGAAFQWNRPRSSVGDELEQADLASGTATYSYRIAGGLEIGAHGEHRIEFLRDSGLPDSRFREFGATVAYSAFRGRLSSEVDLMRGMRLAENPSGEYVEETRQVSVRASPGQWVTLSVRYRQRDREYPGAAPRSSNFLRQDRRRSISGAVDVSLGEHLRWNVSGGVDKGDSTRPGRTFAATLLGTGFTLAY